MKKVQGIDLSNSFIGAQANITLLRLKGYLDTTTSAEVSSKLRELMNSNNYQYIVDMSSVNYVSSAGWGVFVGEIRSIRENGGDLKIVQMTPDVYDVFEMLEFNRILDYYETIEEAVNDFDICQGLDITVNTKLLKNVTAATMDFSTPIPKSITLKLPGNGSHAHRSRFAFAKTQVEESALPLVEKIKVIVIDNPTDGLFKIKKKLNTQRFGYEKASLLKIFKILKNYNLETKQKRYRFYRSR
jgi:anti-sigma B factor antagonist